MKNPGLPGGRSLDTVVYAPFENSTPGYRYLCELFASHGILAATIDANFLLP